MKSSSARLMRVNAVIIFLGVCLGGITASYAEDKKAYSQEQANKAIRKIIPLSRELSPLLKEVLPKKDGKYYPITILFAPDWPNDSENPQRVHFHCPWGATVCEPFLQACTATQQSCSCSDYGSIDPDPC